MNDDLFSFACPKCSNKLYSAFVFNPMFLFGASCPYCIAEVKLTFIPTFLVFLGAILSATSTLALFYDFTLYAQGLEIYALGLGVGCLIFGMMFLRFVELRVKTKKARKSATHITYSS